MTEIVKRIKNFLVKQDFFVDDENKNDFNRELVQENFFRLSIISTLLFVYECYLYLINDKIYNVGDIILIFLVGNVILLPIILFIHFRSRKTNLIFANLIKYTYALLCIVFGISIALHIQEHADYIHMYLLMVFFTSAFIYIHPISSFLLILGTYLVFIYLLPEYVADPTGRLVIITNTAGSNAAAWIMSLIMWRSRISVYKNKKLLFKQNIQLQEISKKDSMTGLFNHETSLLILEKEIERAKNFGYPLSLIISDVDDFKRINDTYGHLYGDNVIKEVAKIMSGTARKRDFVGRYGGEEFIIIMPQTDLKEAYALSDRLHNKIKKSNLSESIKVTLSGGISELHGETTNELIRLTDQKLYAAKASGKNCFKTQLEITDNLTV